MRLRGADFFGTEDDDEDENENDFITTAKLKGPEASLRVRPMPFQQRTNTSWRSIRSQPADSRRLFRCLGAHLLRSP